MTLLDRTLLQRFFGYWLVGLVGFTAIFQLVNLFERIDTFIDTHARPIAVARYYLYGTPAIVQLILPMTLLLATLLALGQTTRLNELLPVRAAGWSIARIVRPILVCAALASIGAFFLGETLVPWSTQRRDRVLAADIRREIPEQPEVRANLTYLGDGGRVWSAKQLDQRDSSLLHVTVQAVRDGRVTWRVDAAAGRYARGAWTLTNGVERTFRVAPGDTTRGVRLLRERAAPFASRTFASLADPPAAIGYIEEQPAQMGAFRLREHIQRVRSTGGRVQRFVTIYHTRWSWPVANIVVTLLGVALASRLRRGGVAVGAGIALFLSFLYYGIMKTGEALGYSGSLPPIPAAWLGNAVYALVAGVLLSRMER